MSKSRIDRQYPVLAKQLNRAAKRGAKAGARKAFKEGQRTSFRKEAANNGGNVTAEQLAAAITGSGSASDIRLVTAELQRSNTAAKILNLQKALDRATDPQKRSEISQALTFEKLRRAAADAESARAILSGYGNRGYIGTDAQAIDRTTGWSPLAPGARGAREQLRALQSDLIEAKKSGDVLKIDEASQRVTKLALELAHVEGRI